MSAAAILALLKTIGSFVLELLTSRIGQIVIAFAIAWGLSQHHTDQVWRDRVAKEKAAEKAAYQKELSREQAATRDLAAQATARLEAEMARSAERTRLIEADKKDDADDKPQPCTVENRVTKVYARPCVIDDAFTAGVRRLDATHRKAAASRSAGPLWKGRRAP